MSSSIASFFSSVFSVVHNDAPEEDKPEDSAQEQQKEEEPEAEEASEEQEEEEEEEEEPEDAMPAIREECKQTPECAPATKHFLHCQEKVEGGNGFKHEDCLEELFHMMHCVDNCSAPKVFAKLR